MVSQLIELRQTKANRGEVRATEGFSFGYVPGIILIVRRLNANLAVFIANLLSRFDKNVGRLPGE